MKWEPKDLEMFLGAREYVDTVVLPLMPISFGEDMKETASMYESMNHISFQLEKQFKGRLLLLPSFTYLKGLGEEKFVQTLKEWEEELVKQEFKNIFYLTADSDWKTYEDDFQGSILWIPYMPIENLDEKSRLGVINEQTKQLTNIFVKKWKRKA